MPPSEWCRAAHLSLSCPSAHSDWRLLLWHIGFSGLPYLALCMDLFAHLRPFRPRCHALHHGPVNDVHDPAWCVCPFARTLRTRGWASTKCCHAVHHTSMDDVHDPACIPPSHAPRLYSPTTFYMQAYYISPFAWSLRALVINEFTTPVWAFYDPPGSAQTVGTCRPTVTWFRI